MKLLFVRSAVTCRVWMELRGSKFFQLPINRSSYVIFCLLQNFTHQSTNLLSKEI
jgi:hypothetical protein